MLNFIKDGFRKRSIIFSLAKRNFYQQFFGSALGFFWAFIEPLLYIGIIYAVFTFGIRAGGTTGIPFSVYFISGMTAWLYFAKCLSGSSGAISQYSYLVGNLELNSGYLPVIGIVSNLFTHSVFVLLAIAIAWLQGFPPTVFTLQIFYYLFAMVMLLLGLSWLTSSTNLFVKDVSKAVNLVTQFGFWLTPIFWNIDIIPKEFHWIIKLNPLYYIVSGYRDSLTGQAFFWEHTFETVYFWTVTVFFLMAGIAVYKKLEPHFGDVL